MTRGPEFFYYNNGVPKNRFGLDDAVALSILERDLTHTRMLEIKNGSAPESTRGQFDLAHLQGIHQHLFQDVYEWAGTTRSQLMTIEGQQVSAPALIHKDDGRMPVPFVPSRLVDHSLTQTFAELKAQNFLQGLPRTEFADRAAVIFTEINTAHPFMEGNGRTQREFMTQLAQQAGHSLNFDVVSAERMSSVSLEARMGDQTGMQRLFQEISDPGRVAAMEKAIGYLENEKINWPQLYLASATPGRDYEGRVALTSQDVVVMRCEGDVIVAKTSDFDTSSGPPRGDVRMTATEYAAPSESSGDQQRSRQIDLDV